MPDPITIKFSDLIVSCPFENEECRVYEFQGLVELDGEAAIPVSGRGEGVGVIYLQTSPVYESIEGSFIRNGEKWTFDAEFSSGIENERNKSYQGSLSRETSDQYYPFKIEAN